MKIAIRSLAALVLVLAAACSAPAPTEPAALAAAAAPSMDGIPPAPDSTARGPNLFGSGN